MLSIEREIGVRATWYFRWRTADHRTIARIREAGGHVGLHYETLTRLVRERGLTHRQVDGALVAEARALLRREIAAFQRRFGAIRSICPHGDSRVPGVSNQILLRGQRPEDYDIAFDGNDAINRLPLSLWLTDRSTPDGRWKDGIDPHIVLGDGTSPVLLVTHPNNWCSGASLWFDRTLSAVFPTPRPDARNGRGTRVARTSVDDPPPLPAPSRQALTHPRPTPFAPIAISLRREVLRFSYDRAISLSDRAGLNTLATNSELAESRAAMLEHALASAGIADVAGLDVLDVGCGFGALALVFAARGARVVGADPNEARMEVGRTVSEMHGLAAAFTPARMEQMDLGHEMFDVAVMNNSLCYVVDRGHRLAALERTFAALRPGGVLVVRNPNRLHPTDQFTGLPLLGLLSPRWAQRAVSLARRHRSEVRLQTNGAARRELRRAGFSEVRSVRRTGESRLRASVTGYQHLTARRPG